MIVKISVRRKLPVDKVFFMATRAYLGCTAVEALVVTREPYFENNVWKMDVTQYPEPLYTRVIYLGDQGATGYTYDSRPDMLQSNAELALAAIEKRTNWSNIQL